MKNRVESLISAVSSGIFFGMWQSSLIAGVTLFSTLVTLSIIKTVE